MTAAHRDGYRGLLGGLLLLVSCTKPNGEFDDPRLKPDPPNSTRQEDSTVSSQDKTCEPELCVGLNDEGTPVSNARLSGIARAVAIEIPAGYESITRMEVMTGQATRPNELALQLRDDSDTPGQQVAAQSWQSSETVDWQGVDFPTPVAIENGQRYWMVWSYDAQDAGNQQASQSETGLAHSMTTKTDTDQAWESSTANFMARVYCCKP